eukprot:3365305-Prymnesium_polylepis.1
MENIEDHDLFGAAMSTGAGALFTANRLAAAAAAERVCEFHGELLHRAVHAALLVTHSAASCA